MVKEEILRYFVKTGPSSDAKSEVIVEAEETSNGLKVSAHVDDMGQEGHCTITVDLKTKRIHMETAFGLDGHGSCLALCAGQALVDLILRCWKHAKTGSDLRACLMKNGVANAAGIAQCVAGCFAGGGSGGDPGSQGAGP